MDDNRILDYFLDLVRIPSPSRQERELADKLKKDLEELGFAVLEDEAGAKVTGNTGNIIGKLKGDAAKPAVILSAHMDTVEKEHAIHPVIKDGVIYSDGTTILSADDKAGICAIMMGLRSFLNKGTSHGDIEVVFTVCEEVGILGAKNLDPNLLTGKMAYVFDSTGEIGVIITNAPAQSKLSFKIIGKAAHAGLEPEKGISAIEVAAKAIVSMPLGRIDHETTANIGIIKGGSATNIVADLVEIEAEARSLDGLKLQNQVNHMVKAVTDAVAFYDAKLDHHIYPSYPAFKFEEDEEIVRRLVGKLKGLNICPVLKSTGGGSDANIFNGYGIKTLNLASGFYNPHSKDEYLPIANLVQLCNVVEAILE